MAFRSLDLNVRSESIKLFEENIVVNLCDLRLSNNFLDMTLKANIAKGKIDKLDFKIKNVCSSKDTIKKMKRWYRGLEGIFSKLIPEKVLLSKYNKLMIFKA